MSVRLVHQSSPLSFQQLEPVIESEGRQQEKNKHRILTHRHGI